MTAPIDLQPEACEARLRAGLTEITEHPEHWDQCVWAATQNGVGVDLYGWPCGTVACLAGVCVLQAGLAHRPPASSPGDLNFWVISPQGLALLAEHPEHQRSWHTPELDFGGLAQLLLGLLGEQGSRLFQSDNTLSELWELAAEFTQGRVSLPTELVERVRATDLMRAAV
jgi:hypothetical protein